MTQAPTAARRFWRILRRLPVTLSLVAALLVLGVVFRGLWEPFQDGPGMETLAYGLRAFEEGRWWTPVTGSVLVAEPWVYGPALVGLGFVAALEWLRGPRVAFVYFWGGQIFAVVATAALLWVLGIFPHWPWAQERAALLDVGPSAGSFACMAALAALLPAVWRLRAWALLLSVVVVGLLTLGEVADLEHLAAVLLVLAVDRSLRPQRTTVREQRLVAVIGLIAFGAIEVILAIMPTSGPFGQTQALSGSAWGTAIDIVIILAIAHGLGRAHRWAWASALALLGWNVAYAVVLAVLLARDPAGASAMTIDGDPAVDIASGVLALILLVYLVLVRGAFARHRGRALGSRATRDDAIAQLHDAGGGTLSWMTTWSGNRYLRTSTGIVAYQEHAGAVIALADPLGPPAGRAESVREFVAAAERTGLTPCVFSAGEATRAAVPDGWRSLVVADDTIVDLPGLEFTGKAWGQVRTSLHRAQREQESFRLTRLADEPWGVRAQVRAISEMWVGDHGLPEMRFTLGTLEGAEDPEVRVALAVSPRGDVDGFLSWLPVYGENGIRGWTLDLMRRRESGFVPVMEFLIGSSAAAFRDEGAQIMSLSGAPLAHQYPPEARRIAELSDHLAAALEPVYGFRSLHRFKEKFHPRYESLYLLYRDEADLPRIAAGLTRAFLPDASVRQFARAGLELLRGD